MNELDTNNLEHLTPEQLRLEELADEVLEGKYGNGIVRKQMLGDDYYPVQAIIDKRYHIEPEVNLSEYVYVGNDQKLLPELLLNKFKKWRRERK